jgi:hypothetical protein
MFRQSLSVPRSFLIVSSLFQSRLGPFSILGPFGWLLLFFFLLVLLGLFLFLELQDFERVGIFVQKEGETVTDTDAVSRLHSEISDAAPKP